jgi:hypothetical protein
VKKAIQRGQRERKTRSNFPQRVIGIGIIAILEAEGGDKGGGEGEDGGMDGVVETAEVEEGRRVEEERPAAANVGNGREGRGRDSREAF